MNHQPFLNTLRAAPDRPLFFETRTARGSVRVGAGYHVTEVRAVNVRAVDCGGRADAWAETIVQLWVPEEAASGPPMTAGKFLSIVARVTADVPAVPTAEVRVEYGDAGKAAVSYHVEGVEVADGAVVVRLKAPRVTCKARDRALEPSQTKTLPVLDTESTGCCGPSSAQSCCA